MSDFNEQEIDALKRVRDSLDRVAADQFVVVGGWAARLLRRHPLARVPAYEPLLTQDLDLAGPERLPKPGVALAKAMESQGFVPEFRSEDRPPVTRYHLKSFVGFELEFIAPLRGGAIRRDG